MQSHAKLNNNWSITDTLFFVWTWLSLYNALLALKWLLVLYQIQVYKITSFSLYLFLQIYHKFQRALSHY